MSDEPAPTTAATTVNIETLLRKLPQGALSLSAQETVDELLGKNPEPLTPEQRKRFVAAAERALRVRREILTLAAFASQHRPQPPHVRVNTCRACDQPWPCTEVLRTAGPALDAVAELKGFGGFLRCETCRRKQVLDNVGMKLRVGWPKCCGYTMRWWTQRQIDAGEVPA